MSVRVTVRAVAVATSVGCCVSLHAQTANPPAAVTLPQINVTGNRPLHVRHRQVRRPAAATRAVSRAPAQPPPAPTAQTAAGGAVSNPFATPPIVQRFQLPNDTVSTTAKQIEETINLKDPEDAIKYFPSLFVRKRNDGDNQAVLATRTWGLNSSARTLIYDDDLLVSALIGNNNSGASPHWNLIVAGSHRADRFSRRSLRGRLSGQFDRRRAADHHQDAGQVRGDRQGDGLGPALESIRHQEHLCEQRRPARRPATATASCHGSSRANYPGRLSAAADLHDQWLRRRRAPPEPIAALNKQGVVADVVGTGALIARSRPRRISRLAYDLLRRGAGAPTRSASGITSRPPIRRPI